MARQPIPLDPTLDELREDLRRSELQLELASTKSALALFETMREAWKADPVVDTDAGWIMTSSGGSLAVDSKNLWSVFGAAYDPRLTRRQSYRAWRTNPHARGILRSLVKFIVGRNFKYDFQDQSRAEWDDAVKRTRLKPSTSEDSPLAMRLIWDDFARRNNWLQRAKEIVLRTFRDGECFVRGFVQNGRVQLRFIEPDHVQSDSDGQTAQAEIEHPDGTTETVATTIMYGIEFISQDIETVVAFHVKPSPTVRAERISAKEIVHVKCNADANDLRGFPFLEVILKRLTQYEQWEEYRILLNKVRTAVALVRKVEGTQQQAAAIVAGRTPARTASPPDAEPQTASGAREAVFKPGTVLTPGPGVTYDMINAKMNAQDAQHDGRRILLTIAAAAGLPEMFVTGDYSNSNFASTAEAVKIAMREWEDWQDFFEPVFTRIFEWVVEAAIEGLGLPRDVDRSVVIQWPTMIVEDPEKQTARRATLFQNGILSRTTWAAMESLVYDDEQENMREEAEELGATPTTPNANEEPDEDDVDAQSEAIHRVHDALLQLDDLQRSFQNGTSAELREAAERYIASARNVLMASAR